MNDDRRQSPRQNLASLIYLDLEQNNGGIVLDLSEGGMQISVANPLMGSGEIRFSLCLETRKRIEGSGRIAWISSSGKSAGVRFERLPPHALSQIRQCLSTQAPAPEPDAAECGPESEAAAATTVEPPATAAPEAVLPAEGIAEAASSIPASHERDIREQNEVPEVSTPEFPEDGPAVTEEMAEEGYAEEQPRSTEQMVAGDIGENVAQEEKRASVGDERPTVESETGPGAGRAKPSPPPWLEKLIQAGRREEFEGEVSYGEFWTTPQTDADCSRRDEAELARGEQADGEDTRLPEVAPAPLYLPNYRIEETHAGDESNARDDHGEMQLRMAAKLACERFEEFGWTLERDWHIWLALVLLAAGFLALAQNPPLTVLSGALWIASAIIALKRKERPRPLGQGDRNRQ